MARMDISILLAVREVSNDVLRRHGKNLRIEFDVAACRSVVCRHARHLKDRLIHEMWQRPQGLKKGAHGATLEPGMRKCRQIRQPCFFDAQVSFYLA